MTPSEFKAWFDGFTEAMGGTPTKAQWARIQARVAEIDGKPVTHTVYVDRYLPSVRPYYRDWTTWYGTCGSTSGGTTGLATSLVNATGQNGVEYDSHKAMLLVGRAEAKSLAA